MLLEQPGRIGALRLKNRVVMAPMGTNYSTTDGLSTERDKLYYAERARGGVAMIMTEAMVVTEHARPHHNSLCCYHDRFIPGLASIVAAIKAHDCHVFGQLNHRGALLRRSVLNMEPVGPSPWKNPNTGDEVRPLAIPEIVGIQKLFVEAARRLRQAGYDGAEIHAGNGYLFQQFFTPRINRRTDCYGGSFDNRARFLIETIRRVRDALPDFPLIVRLSASEFVAGSYTEAEIIELAARLEHEAVAALDLSGGSNESPQLSKYCIQPPSFKRGCLGPYARPIRQAVKIPVFVAGRVVDPEDAEALLREGCADFISLGRALYADPHWCLKAFGRVNAPIRKCIACNVCFERLTLEKDVACVHNPMIGTEFEALEHAAARVAAMVGLPELLAAIRSRCGKSQGRPGGRCRWRSPLPINTRSSRSGATAGGKSRRSAFRCILLRWQPRTLSRRSRLTSSLLRLVQDSVRARSTFPGSMQQYPLCTRGRYCVSRRRLHLRRRSRSSAGAWWAWKPPIC